MDIIDYFSFFHDGSLFDINCKDSVIVLSMESAEISPEENKDKIVLSKYLTIKGKLHLEGVGTITENDKIYSGRLRMLYDNARILHLEREDKIIKLGLEWVNYPPNPDITAYSFYCIEAINFWWETIPDLCDQFEG